MGGKTIDKKCKRCGAKMTVKLSVHKRGHGVFCSHLCRASDHFQRNHALPERTFMSPEDHIDELARADESWDLT